MIMSCYTAARSEGLSSFRYFVVMIAVLGGLLTWLLKLAIVEEKSTEFMESVKPLEGRQPWLRRFLKSVRPLRVEIAMVGYADRGLILTVATLIVDNTVSLLLTA